MSSALDTIMPALAMRACGHCAHMAMLLGAANLLQKDGALDNVAAIFAGHVTHEFETNKIMIRDGTVTAQSDGFTIRVRGKGGHGARPHEAIDAVVIGGFLITALQTLISRETNPLSYHEKRTHYTRPLLRSVVSTQDQPAM